MATPPFTIQVVRDEASAALAESLAKLKDLRPLMRGIAGILEDEAQQAFADEADPATGAPWPEYLHAEDPAGHPNAYIHRPRPRGRGGQTHPKLQVSGDLAKLYTEIGATFALVGSGEVQSALMQFGGTSDMPPGPAAVPARPFLGLSPDGELEILNLAGRYLRP